MAFSHAEIIAWKDSNRGLRSEFFYAGRKNGNDLRSPRISRLDFAKPEKKMQRLAYKNKLLYKEESIAPHKEETRW
jgi:hypothetical protein